MPQRSPLGVTPAETRDLSRLLGRERAGSLTRRPHLYPSPPPGAAIETYVVEISGQAPSPDEHDGVVEVTANVLKVEDGALVVAEHDVRAVNVTASALPSGRYAACRDPYSGVYVLAGAEPGPDPIRYSTGTVVSSIGGNQKGTVDTERWGEVEAWNLYGGTLVAGTMVDVRLNDLTRLADGETDERDRTIVGADICTQTYSGG